MKIATHNGPFHCDDVVAVAVLLHIHPGAEIIRTRNPELLATADIRVDVGGVFDPANSTYDHHFKGSPVGPRGVRLSSAGMIWQDFGSAVVAPLAEGLDPQPIADQVYADLIAAIDAADNGEAEGMAAPGVENFTFSHAVSDFNPRWDEAQSPQDFMARFMQAVEFATGVLTRAITRAVGTAKAAGLVREAINGDPDVVVLDRFMPWHEVLVPETTNVKFVVFPNPEGTWMVQAVPPSLGSFGQRKPLPEAWAGLRDAELANVTGVPDAVFCHPGRFIGGAKSKDGAMNLANQAVLA